MSYATSKRLSPEGFKPALNWKATSDKTVVFYVATNYLDGQTLKCLPAEKVKFGPVAQEIFKDGEGLLSVTFATDASTNTKVDSITLEYASKPDLLAHYNKAYTRLMNQLKTSQSFVAFSLINSALLFTQEKIIEGAEPYFDKYGKDTPEPYILSCVNLFNKVVAQKHGGQISFLGFKFASAAAGGPKGIIQVSALQNCTACNAKELSIMNNLGAVLGRFIKTEFPLYLEIVGGNGSKNRLIRPAQAPS